MMESKIVRVELPGGDVKDFTDVNFFNVQDGVLLLGNHTEKEARSWFSRKISSDLTVVAIFSKGSWENCYVVDNACRNGSASVERIRK